AASPSSAPWSPLCPPAPGRPLPRRDRHGCGSLKQHPGAELIDARPLLPDVPALGDGPDVQLWPHMHGTDAMYLAILRRIA
ncbi:hypothetical protein ABT136_30580, partial [Streptomyces sp. NPDC001856]